MIKAHHQILAHDDLTLDSRFVRDTANLLERRGLTYFSTAGTYLTSCTSTSAPLAIFTTASVGAVSPENAIERSLKYESERELDRRLAGDALGFYGLS